MRIYFDMDGVLADIVTPWLKIINDEAGTDYQYGEINMWKMGEVVTELSHERLMSAFHKPGFWTSLPPYQEAINFALRLHQEGHEVHIATTPYNSHNCAWEKSQWFEEHLPFLPYDRLILIHNKHLLEGDVLIDDKPSNLIYFDGCRILFTQPWNYTAKDEGLFRAFNWHDVREIMTFHSP